MKKELKDKISEFLESKVNQNIINSDDFYFQKAKDALNQFLSLEVSNETKTFLITNKREYNKLKLLFESSEELAEFGKVLFTLISYCDLRADRKKEFNQYDDKRTLAMASVRMNNWVEHLITYKFSTTLVDGSIKNAVEYLLNPEKHCTMLSENQRSQLCENLLRRNYVHSTFTNDLINYFSEFSIKTKNPLNFTHLLTRIIYSISAEWKENIIGLICPDGTGWQENVVSTPESINYLTVWNHRKPNIPNKTLPLLRACIEENGFFKIFYSYDHTVHYVAEVIDFVSNQSELDKAEWLSQYPTIDWDGANFSDYTDGSKNASIIYLVNKFYKINPISESNFKYYANKKYPSVGSQAPVISYITNEETNNLKIMEKYITLLDYKKQIILQGPPGTGKTRFAKQIAHTITANNKIYNADGLYSTSRVMNSFLFDILGKLKKGEKILSSNGKTSYLIKEVKNDRLVLSGLGRKQDDTVVFETLIDYIDNREKYPLGTGLNSQYIAVLDYVLEKINKEKKVSTVTKKEEKFIKIIQFHPSYSYEDFVRGISAESNKNDQIEYKVVNKVLTELANDALLNKNEKYVLIIDEINRANLSSVLGELIYALEYRYFFQDSDENKKEAEVESLYGLKRNNSEVTDRVLKLPENLYIIGTMNTADRSVGHIDYAIRRRFAFVDLLPKQLEDDKIVFHKIWFKKVSELFIENYDEFVLNENTALKRAKTLSEEFRPEDVWIGHSYFIQKKLEGDVLEPADFRLRIDYEIKPILLEYVKDGVLMGKVGEVKVEDYIKSF